MSETPSGPRSIHPAIQGVWRFSAATTSVFLVAGAALFEGLVLMPIHGWPFRVPVVLPGVFVALGILSQWMVRRQWQRWTYEVREHDLVLSWGVIWQTRRVVARDRIQHLDINSGPLDRRFGLVQVVVYVAGGSVGAIPGLTPQEAELLRSVLLAGRGDDV
ncbi:MAG: PH domain-containing protein [Fimbriimonadaceae bacterium]|nr:PH domain-containing protein [Chthonomonadaceae bacterium]MCO5295837.1 PH domain-containing protein [Fimbriimonadaceae bacterium]